MDVFHAKYEAKSARGALHLLWLWTLRICTVQFIIRTSPDNVDSLIFEIFVP